MVEPMVIPQCSFTVSITISNFSHPPLAILFGMWLSVAPITERIHFPTPLMLALAKCFGQQQVKQEEALTHVSMQAEVFSVFVKLGHCHKVLASERWDTRGEDPDSIRSWDQVQPAYSLEQSYSQAQLNQSRLSLLLLLFLCRATLMAYGSSWARGQIRAIAAGIHHSHRNTRSEPHLWRLSLG